MFVVRSWFRENEATFALPERSPVVVLHVRSTGTQSQANALLLVSSDRGTTTRTGASTSTRM